MSSLHTVVLRDKNISGRLTERFRLIREHYAEDFIEAAQERYENYVSHVHFAYVGGAIPSALDLVVFEVDQYGQHSPLYDFAADSIAEELHEDDPVSFPDPYGDHWEDGHAARVTDIVADFWEDIQADLVHDLEVVFLEFGFSFVIPNEKGESRVINNPIVEVW